MSEAQTPTPAVSRDTLGTAALYGTVPSGLVDLPEGAVQLSPTIPGSAALDEAEDGAFTSALVMAPPGTIERRFVLAHALRATRVGGSLAVLAPKDRGGSRLRHELESFGCAVDESARRHHRICQLHRPAQPVGLDDAVAAGAPREVEALGLWSQPGIFSWDRVDPGSAHLAAQMTGLAGRGADLGCGTGWLGQRILAVPAVTELALVDLDRRAVACTDRNLTDSRARTLWTDVRAPSADAAARLTGLDFVAMNPPFHAAGAEDRALGQAFIRAAAAALRRGGVCWLVANRHLPYERVLGELFKEVTPGEERGGFKVFRARK